MQFEWMVSMEASLQLSEVNQRRGSGEKPALSPLVLIYAIISTTKMVGEETE